MARSKYDEAKGQRELAEQKTAEHRQLESEQQAMQQRLYDADAQLASMSGDVEQHVSALNEAQNTRMQQAGKLQAAEEEVERIARQLAMAQDVVAQLKQDVEAVAVSLHAVIDIQLFFFITAALVSSNGSGCDCAAETGC